MTHLKTAKYVVDVDRPTQPGLVARSDWCKLRMEGTRGRGHNGRAEMPVFDRPFQTDTGAGDGRYEQGDADRLPTDDLGERYRLMM